MKGSRPLLLAALATLSLAGLAAAWRQAGPGYPWSFPRDHWSHPDYRIEWWYFAGTLADSSTPARRFGYQLTFFRIGLLPNPVSLDSLWASRHLLMGHAAVGDFAAGRHRFSDLLYRETPLLAGFASFPDPRLVWSRAPAGTEGNWELRWNGAGFDFNVRDDPRGMAFDLTTQPVKPLVLEGPGGASRKGPGDAAASLYYSFTRLQTSGTVTLEGRSFPVQGESWMDREFSTTRLTPDQVGWDWFALRLVDGRDLMLYRLRRKDGGTDFKSATLVSPDGKATYLAEKDWSVKSTSTWKSRATGTAYPSRWEIEVPQEGLRLTVIPRMPDQENIGSRSADLRYWEGAVLVTGTDGGEAGEGYVELTGYGAHNRPPV